MIHKDSVAILCSLLKPDNDARPTFLFGAGASFSSGVPLAISTTCFLKVDSLQSMFRKEV
jgi:hypothetical protein